MTRYGENRNQIRTYADLSTAAPLQSRLPGARCAKGCRDPEHAGAAFPGRLWGSFRQQSVARLKALARLARFRQGQGSHWLDWWFAAGSIACWLASLQPAQPAMTGTSSSSPPAASQSKQSEPVANQTANHLRPLALQQSSQSNQLSVSHVREGGGSIGSRPASPRWRRSCWFPSSARASPAKTVCGAACAVDAACPLPAASGGEGAAPWPDGTQR